MFEDQEEEEDKDLGVEREEVEYGGQERAGP